MQVLNISFRKYNFKIFQENQITYIFDEVRKKNVILTPEEWVRQNFIHFFIYDLAYPRTKIAIEKEFILNGLKKRFDLLVFDRSTKPLLLLECKSQKEAINQRVLSQCLNYNIKFQVPFLLISNGDFTFGWEIKEEEILDLIEMPKYQ